VVLAGGETASDPGVVELHAEARFAFEALSPGGAGREHDLEGDAPTRRLLAGGEDRADPTTGHVVLDHEATHDFATAGESVRLIL
jgi:hypothetical protein